MEWLKELFVEHSALQAVVVVSLISTIGIGLGKIRFFGISLGTAFIFFVGILAGHFGLSLDPAMLTYAESFGLVIFVYALGLQVGPGFFSSMRADGLRLVSPAIAIVLLGTALAMAMSYAFGVSMPDMSGILCGATTNTPALGAAQQTLQQMGIDANGAALSCAVAYPLGVVGVILAVVFLRKLFVRPCDMPGPDAEHRKNVFIASYRLTNPAVFGKSVHEIAVHSHHHFVISRLWRNGQVSIPTSDRQLQRDDVILVITNRDEADALRMLTELQGRRHTVCTGVTVRRGGEILTESASTDVYFRPAAEAELWGYIRTGEPMDKAGAYGVQGLGALLVERLDGDFFNVMGLPVLRLSRMLERFGVHFFC